MVQTVIINSSNVLSNTYNSRYRLNLAKPWQFKAGSKISLRSIQIPYSWFNISAEYQNNSFSIIIPYAATTQTINITIPDGFYTLESINNYLIYILMANGFYFNDANGNVVVHAQFIYNISSYKVELDCFPISTTLPTGYSYGSLSSGWGSLGLPTTVKTMQVVFPSSSSVGSLLGFSAQTFPLTNTSTTTQSILSNNTPNLSPVSSVIVQCNLVNNPYSLYSNTLFSFTPNTTYGSIIDVQSQSDTFVNITEGLIQYIEIWLTDQNYNQIKLMDPNLCIQLLIKDANEL